MTEAILSRITAPGPKRILTLDGGGSRGLISLIILARVEEILAKRSADPDAFRLSDYFDLIAGTSTGSIIASGLAMGWRVSELIDLYEGMLPRLFPKRWYAHLPLLGGVVQGTRKLVFHARDARKLDRVLRTATGEITLGSDALKTGLLIAAKRIDTDSQWLISNSPKSAFYDSPHGDYKPNRDYALHTLIRASTAAPTYFQPERILIDEGSGVRPPQYGLFLDGALSGHNNPALAALKVATLAGYGFGWSSGADKLMLVSVGTGTQRTRRDEQAFQRMPAVLQAVGALESMISAVDRNTLATMQAMSEPNRPWPLDGEIGGLQGQLVADEPLLHFQRLDTSLELDDVATALDWDGVSDKKRLKMHKAIIALDMGDRKVLRQLRTLGEGAAAQVEERDFPPGFDMK